jgi:alpha,alpha-trehalase
MGRNCSPEQAEKVRANLPIFERTGGLHTSDHITGDQWDAPFGWAPLHIMAVEGLRGYAFNNDADRISLKFLAMVIRDSANTGPSKKNMMS